MTWTTNQLAGLAGTTTKTIRHYHKLELLPEPERMANGYRQYQISHLVRLRQVIRLAELGMPLASIASMNPGDERPALQSLDDEHAASVRRLDEMRAQLSEILQHQAPADAPAGFSERARDLPQADRSLITGWSSIFIEDAVADTRQMVKDASPNRAFDELAPNADRATRRHLSHQLAPVIRQQLDTYPWLRDRTTMLRSRVSAASDVAIRAVWELYNPAQFEVVTRASLLALDATGELDALEKVVKERPEWPSGGHAMASSSG